jgi:hypothetical protein
MICKMFKSGDKVNWKVYDENMLHVYGHGPFFILEIADVLDGEKSWYQWVTIGKNIDGKCMVYSRFKKQWCRPVSNPNRFLDGPEFILGSWFKKVR